MAPILDEATALMGKRATCPTGQYWDRRYGRCVYAGAWSGYGRWIFAAVVIAIFFLILFLWACCNSRRRRRQGAHPMYGTGWLAPNAGQHNQQQHYDNNQGYQQPPPAYGAPPQSYPQSYPMENRYHNPEGAQYGQQASGVEPPKNVYTGDYAPPAGPPPGK